MKITCLYATTGGNTQMVCEWVQDLLCDAGCAVRMMRVEEVDPKTFFDGLATGELLIVASPTYGHGQLEPNAEKFYAKALGTKLKARPCAVIGLGHDKYDDDYNVESAVILSDFVTAHNGKLIIDALKVNRNPVPQLQKQVTTWTKKLIKKLSE